MNSKEKLSNEQIIKIIFLNEFIAKIYYDFFIFVHIVVLVNFKRKYEGIEDEGFHISLCICMRQCF